MPSPTRSGVVISPPWSAWMRSSSRCVRNMAFSYYQKRWDLDGVGHKLHNIYLEYHSVCPSSKWYLSPPPPPLPQASVTLPPEPKGVGGNTRLQVKGWGSPNSDDWRKSLAFCLLCGVGGSFSVQVSGFSVLYSILHKSQLDKGMEFKKN
jgi:hypothetical protein